ncbi:hypothetical protein [Cryobacterium sp. Y62]|uniref:hypothetical protein n=1 Tax=Cryobacterium sp. Y62 TaxID=2048284 RepID=UPI000CE4E3F6|nr:hypothetical protein [Cryobacterium sp. Y62]
MGTTTHGIRYPDGTTKAVKLGEELATMAGDLDAYIYENAVEGPVGLTGAQGLAGTNANPADTAVASYISTTGTSETQTAADARYLTQTEAESRYSAVSGTVTLSTGVTSEFVSLTRTGNIVSLFISNATRSAAWSNAAQVASIPAGFRPPFGAPVMVLNGSTGDGRSGSVTGSGALLIFGETGAGSSGRVSCNGSWPVV